MENAKISAWCFKSFFRDNKAKRCSKRVVINEFIDSLI